MEALSVSDAFVNCRKRLGAWTTEHMNRRTLRPASPLFHYTGEHELESILRSGRMWFTDYRHLNDDQEVAHGLELALQVIAEIKAQTLNPKLGLFLDLLADLFRQSSFDATLAFFVGSMSEDPDSPYQWKRYGRNGRGVAIGIAPHILAPDDDLSPLANENACLGRVVYKPDAAASYHREGILNALAAFEKALTLCPSASGREAFALAKELAIDLIATTLIWNCVTCKAPSWQIEKEVRLVTLAGC
jgi:hypothetical protein